MKPIRPTEIVIEFPGYPFGRIRAYLRGQGVEEPLSDVEAESAYFNDHEIPEDK